MNSKNNMNKSISLTLGLVSLVGFILSLLTHVVSLLGIDVLEYVPFVWVLHLGIFIVFIPLIFHMRKTVGKKPQFADLKGIFPNWIIWLCGLIFAYAFVNFFIFMKLTNGGGPAILDGKYVLQEHGKLIAELTMNQYHSFKANEIRGFSGHWLAFYFLPFAYFCFGKNINREPSKTK